MICDDMSDKIIEAARCIATEEGAEALTVRKILIKLNITNRVFYNRFKNINEVLEIVYKKTVLKIRESIMSDFEANTCEDFFEHINEVLTNLLILSYEAKKQLNQYVFLNDSISPVNFEWWMSEVKKLIEYAKVRGFFKPDIDADILSYSIWCFCRGYNADALGRNLPRDEAIENFKYSFGFLLQGMKA
jgi:AcrR family transcriptional regulator